MYYYIIFRIKFWKDVCVVENWMYIEYLCVDMIGMKFFNGI